MKISFDRKADALYIEFSRGKFGSNKKLDDETVLDLDKYGKILGIEILSASKRIPVKVLKSYKVETLA